MPLAGMRLRIKSLLEKVSAKDADGFLLSEPNNIFYFSGFRSASQSVLLLLTGSPSALIVPELEFEAASSETSGLDVAKVPRGGKLVDQLSTIMAERRVGSLLTDEMPLLLFRSLSEKVRNVKLTLETDLIWELRKIKDSSEIEKIREAAKLADEGFKAACDKIRSGIREFELAAEIEYAMRRSGSEGLAFDSIVASGVRSSLPHGTSTHRRIETGDLVVIDIGAVFGGYRSDLTRTLCLGHASDEKLRMFDVVRTAQSESHRRLLPGTRCGDVDSAARRVIEAAGYGEFFVHGVGHGVGLDIHEPPRLGIGGEEVLAEGNVVTNEPGVYVPGLGGVRVEDTVVVRAGGAEALTHAPKLFEV